MISTEEEHSFEKNLTRLSLRPYTTVIVSHIMYKQLNFANSKTPVFIFVVKFRVIIYIPKEASFEKKHYFCAGIKAKINRD